VRWPCTEVNNTPTLEFFALYQLLPHKVPLAILINVAFVGLTTRGATKFQGWRRKDPTGDFHHL
jgi:hypothetical protein